MLKGSQQPSALSNPQEYPGALLGVKERHKVIQGVL